MSESLRRSLRTQGRFGEIPQEQKKGKKSHEGSSEKGPPVYNMQSPGSKVEYLQVTPERSSFFKEVTPDKPIIISDQGYTTLSKSNNGESRIYFDQKFYHEDQAQELYDFLHEETDWYKKKVTIHGEEYNQPRLVSWFGPLPYAYSGVNLSAREFPEYLLKVKEDVELALKNQPCGINAEFNSVLLNLYRHNKDSVAWHSDDESSMGVCPTIASVSLGAMRRFEMKRKPVEGTDRNVGPAEYLVHLTHGSLIVMDGAMQTDWLHRVPKEYHDREPRINLTFRTVFKAEENPSTRTHFQARSPVVYEPLPKMIQQPFRMADDDFPDLSNHSKKPKSRSHSPPVSTDIKPKWDKPTKKGVKNFSKNVKQDAKAMEKHSDVTSSHESNLTQDFSNVQTQGIDNSSDENRNAVDNTCQSKLTQGSPQNDVHDNNDSSDENKNASGDEFQEDVRQISDSPDSTVGDGNTVVDASNLIQKSCYEDSHWISSTSEENTDSVYDSLTNAASSTVDSVADNTDLPRQDTVVPEESTSKESVSEDDQSDEVSSVPEQFRSLPPLEFNQEYRDEGKRLSEIYCYVKSNMQEISFTGRDRQELEVLFTVIEESGPLRLKVMRAIADRMAQLCNYAENRSYRNASQFPKRPYGRRNNNYYNY